LAAIEPVFLQVLGGYVTIFANAYMSEGNTKSEACHYLLT